MENAFCFFFTRRKKAYFLHSTTPSLIHFLVNYLKENRARFHVPYYSTLSTLLRARFIHKLSDACQVLALIANFKTTDRTDFLLVFGWRGGKVSEFACFKRVSRLLETARITTEQTFETFTFATFNIYHKFFTPFQCLRIMLGLCRNIENTSRTYL